MSKTTGKRKKTVADVFRPPPSNCWLPRNMRKTGLTAKASQTPGSAKGWNCQRDPESAYMAKRNRSHKHPHYSEWCRRHTGSKNPYGKVDAQ